MSEEKQDRIIKLLTRIHNNQLSINQNVLCTMSLVILVLVIAILLLVLYLLS